MPGKATQSMAALTQTIEELQRNQKALGDTITSQSNKLSIIEKDVQMVTVERFAVIIHSFTSDIIPLLRKEFDESVKMHEKSVNQFLTKCVDDNNDIKKLLNEVLEKNTELISQKEETLKTIKNKNRVLSVVRDVALVLIGGAISWGIELVIKHG